MARLTVEERSAAWTNKIRAALDVRNEWAKTFRLKSIEEAYYGYQWQDQDPDEDDPRYVLNMIFSAIDVKQPSLLFQEPIFDVKPKPGRQRWNPDRAFASATLKTDTLNHFVLSEQLQFSDRIEAAILDAFFGFGVIETGYSAEWILNPVANKPHLISDDSEESAHDGKLASPLKKLPVNERLYVKQVPYDHCIVGGIQSRIPEECDFFAYWEWVKADDIRSGIRDGRFSNLDENMSFSQSPDIQDSEDSGIFHAEAEIHQTRVFEGDPASAKKGDVAKVWKIWDHRAKNFMIMEDSSEMIIWEKPFKRFPVKFLKFRHMRKGFYPYPFVYNWISPQNEINETRESGRNHRRRFIRKFILAQNALTDPDELAKLESNQDGVVIQGEKPDPSQVVFPVPNPDLGAQHSESLIVTKDDFRVISGTSSESTVDRETATKSKINDARSRIRESRDKLITAKFLNQVGKELLQLASEKLTKAFYIELTNNEKVFEDIQETAQFQQVDPVEDLDDGVDFSVNVSVSSMSPVDQEQEKEAYAEFLSFLTNFPQISLSPALVRETADRVGYKNEKVIKEMQQLGQLGLLGMLTQAENNLKNLQLQGAQLDQAGNQFAQQKVAQASPNTAEQVDAQLNNQVVQ